MQDRNEEVEIDLLELCGVLLQKIWVLVICMVIGGAVCFMYSALLVTPMYQSTTTAYVYSKNEGNMGLTYSDTQLASQVIKDAKEIIKSRHVLEEVIDLTGTDMDYDELKDKVSVQQASDTRIITITVKDASPVMAQTLADTIREVSGKSIKNVMNIEAINVVDKANLPTHKCEPSVKKYTLVGMIIGLVVAVGIVVLMYLMDDTIKTADDIERYLGLTTLAVIPEFGDASKNLKEKNRQLEGKPSRQPRVARKSDSGVSNGSRVKEKL